MKRLALLLPALLPCLWGCGASSLLDSTAPWIKASWVPTQGRPLDAQEVGILRIKAGAYGNGSLPVYFISDKGLTYNPSSTTLDQFGTVDVPLYVSGHTCASGTTGPVFDSLTLRMSTGGTNYTARIAVACQDAVR